MKRFLSAVLVIVMLAATCNTALAVSFSDTGDHWAKGSVDYLTGKGVVNGYTDGTFKPNNKVSRAEFIKMLDATFGLSATTSIRFTDVESSAWFYPFVAQAAAQGYLLNYGTTLNPNGELSREEAVALLVRYIDPDPSVKASVSEFTDYNKIRPAYRDYVLQAVAQNLITGYAVGSSFEFRPTQTLTRAEALTILYRAAGTIYNTVKTGTDAAAAKNNGVVTVAGTVITDAVLGGRVIISEGVANDDVTLKDCEIGELVIRGTPTSVILDGTTVDTLIVDCNSANFDSKISLKNLSEVTDATFETPAEINLASRTILRALTVNPNAENSRVSGAGTLSKVNVKAHGFVSDRKPAAYDIDPDITASFGGERFTVASSATGFLTDPSTYATVTAVYVSGTAAVDGTVYVYLTNTADAPTYSTYDVQFNAAAVHKTHSVAQGSTFDLNAATAPEATGYLYAVILMRDTAGTEYTPVVIPNLGANGFSVSPTVSTSGNYEYLNYTPAMAGTVYYYYTNETTAPSASTFTSTYNSSAVTLKGTLAATRGTAASRQTQQITSVSSYKSVVVMMTDTASGAQYAPVLVSRTATMGTGFNQEPFCSASTAGFRLMYSTSVTGTLEYYFSASNSTVSASLFSQYKAAVGTALSGQFSVTPGQGSQTISAIAATQYPYLVVRLTSSNGTIYQPVVITVTGVSGTGATTSSLENTGFTAAPTLGAQNGNYTLTFSTAAAGVVYYYVTNNSNVPNGNEFKRNWQSSTSANLAQKNGGSYQSMAGFAQTMNTNLPTNLYNSFKYLVLWFDPTGSMMYSGTTTPQNPYGTTGGIYNNPFVGQTTQISTGYTPLLVTLTEQQSSGDSGFMTLPAIAYDYTGLTISYMPAYSGEIFYYFTPDPSVPDASSVIGRFLFNTDYEYEQGSTVVSAGHSHKLSFAVDAKLSDYIVMVLRDSNQHTYSPIVAALDGSLVTGSTSTGFAQTPTVSNPNGILMLNYNVTEPGTLYYFFTPYGSTAYFSTYTAFMSQYNSMNSSYSGMQQVATMGSGSIPFAGKTTQPYLALLFVGASRQNNTPILISTSVASTSTNPSATAAATGFSTTPTLSGGILNFTPTVQGTLYYAFSDSDSYSELMQPVQSYIYMMMLYGRQGTTGTQTSAASMNWQTISSMIAQSGGGSAQYISSLYMQQQLNLTGRNTTNKRYLVVWIVPTGGASMYTPVFLNAASIGSTGGTGTTTNPYTNPTNPFGVGVTTTTGFSAGPTWTSYTQQLGQQSYYGKSGRISFTPSVSGQLFVLYTNSMISSGADFQNQYTVASNPQISSGVMAAYEPMTTVTAGQASEVFVSNKNYSYAYLYLYTGQNNPYIPAMVYMN